MLERLHRPIKDAFRTKFVLTPNIAELETIVCQLEAYLNSRPIGFVRTSNTDAHEVITPIELVCATKFSFIPEYRTKQGYRITDLPTGLDVAKRRKLLDMSLSSIWNRWAQSYIQDQNSVPSSVGTRMAKPKLGDVCLINSLEMGLPRGSYITGVITKLLPNDENIRSVTVKYMKNHQVHSLTKSLHNIILLEIGEVPKFYS